MKTFSLKRKELQILSMISSESKFKTYEKSIGSTGADVAAKSKSQNRKDQLAAQALLSLLSRIFRSAFSLESASLYLVSMEPVNRRLSKT